MTQDTGLSLITAFLKFAELGAEWVMWLMVALGFLLVMLAIERMRLYLRTRVDAGELGRDLVQLLDAGSLDDARAQFARGRGMEERVLADALEVYNQGPVVIEQTMRSALVREKQRYNRFLNYFGTIGNNAPGIGLLGTVIGIILAFNELAANPAGGLEVVGPAIAEALVATAVGLIVAIPSVATFNGFKSTVNDRISNTDFLASIVLAHANQRED